MRLKPLPLLKLSALIALGLLALSGCATMQETKDPLRSALAADEGTAILSITVNTGEVGRFSRIEVAPANPPADAPPASYILRDALPGLSRDTALFVGVLPAGEYRFKTLYADSSQKFLNINPRQAEVIGSFKVQAGATSDLGRLVLTAANFKVLVGRSKLIADNRALITSVATDYLRLLEPAPISGWVGPHHEGDIAETFALVHPQGAGGFVELPDGTILGGTRMGTALQRGIDGRWKVAARSGQLDAILATSPYPVGDSIGVAGGELSSFLRIEKGGKTTAIDRGNLPAGSIFFIHHAPDYSQWFVGVQTPGKATLYRSTTLERGDWQVAQSDTTEFSTWSGARGVWFWPLPGGVGYASTAGKELRCLDFASGQWTASPAPDGRAITGLVAGPTGAVGVLTSPGGGLGGVFAKTHVSRDCGKTWQETQSPYSVKVSAPLVIANGSILEGGGVFGDKGLYASKDGGEWTKLSDSVSFTEAIYSFPTAGLLGVSRGNLGFESIEHSPDGGTTWKLEVTSIDRRLLTPSKDAAKPAAPSEAQPATPPEPVPAP